MIEPFQTMNGLKIVILQPTPKMKLSPDVPVTDEFRSAFNTWALEFFGVTYVVPKGQTVLDKMSGVLYVRADDYHNIRKLPSNDNWVPYFNKRV